MRDFLVDNTLVILLGFGTIFNVYWISRHKADLRLSNIQTITLAILHTFLGVASVKIFAVLETMNIAKAGAMSLFGAIFFMPLLYYGGAKVFKRNVEKTFDIFTPCIVMSVMLARINCILSGCCLGRYIPGQAPMRWPTREIEIVFYVILLAWIIRNDKKKRRDGYLYPIYMISYGALRFILEGFRASESISYFHLAHIWAMICFAIGLSVYFELGKRCGERRNKR